MGTEASKTHMPVCNCPKCQTDVDIPYNKVLQIWDDAIQHRLKDLWDKLYSKRYDDRGLGQYDTPKAVAYAMLDGIIQYIDKNIEKDKPLVPNKATVTKKRNAEAVWTGTMLKHNSPTYYLSYDLAEALNNTTPADVVDWLDMKLPFDAAAYMIPKGILVHPIEGNVAFVAYTRNLASTSVYMPLPTGKRWELQSVNDCFNIIVRTDRGVSLHWTLDGSFRWFDFDNESGWMEEMVSRRHTAESYQPLDNHDRKILNKAVKLLFNILLFVTEKPHMIESEHLLKQVKDKKTGSKIEYWKPHVIGRNYKLRRPPSEYQGGTHVSPRGHWVSGFWRNQPYGPFNKLRRLLWIEPFWRGGITEGETTNVR